MSFQLPLVHGREQNSGNSDYVSWLHSPGIFENPVDSDLYCGIPLISYRGKVFYTKAKPISIKKILNGIIIVHDQFRCIHDAGPGVLTGRREIRYTVNGSQVHAAEKIQFKQCPDGCVIAVPKVKTGLAVRVDACSSSAYTTNVPVAGISAWRSFWGKIESVIEIHIKPSTELQLQYTMEVLD